MDETSFKYFLADCWLCTFTDKHAHCILLSKSEWKHEKRRTEMIMMWHSFFVRREWFVCASVIMYICISTCVYECVFWGIARKSRPSYVRHHHLFPSFCWMHKSLCEFFGFNIQQRSCCKFCYFQLGSLLVT